MYAPNQRKLQFKLLIIDYKCNSFQLQVVVVILWFSNEAFFLQLLNDWRMHFTLNSVICIRMQNLQILLLLRFVAFIH